MHCTFSLTQHINYENRHFFNEFYIHYAAATQPQNKNNWKIRERKTRLGCKFVREVNELRFLLSLGVPITCYQEVNCSVFDIARAP